MRKDLDSLLLTINDKDKQLERTLNTFDIILLGLGAIIGSGMFVLTGIAAAVYTGPAVVIAFTIGGMVCIISALAFAELASVIPSAGGVYTFSYVILGKMAAWITAWNLIFACLLGIGIIADGWSFYIAVFLRSIGINIPEALLLTPLEGGIIDLPAVFIIILLSVSLVKGTKKSVNLNAILTGIKILVILIFFVFITPHVDPINWQPFMPYKFWDVMAGSAFLFTAFTGFEYLANAAEECKTPSRNLPLGIIGALLICIVIYVIFSILLVGVCNYKLLNNPDSVAFVLEYLGYHFGAELITIGILCGLTSALIFSLFTASRVLFSLSRDNLISSKLHIVHQKYKTPYKAIFVASIIGVLIAGFVPIRFVAESASVCTIFLGLVALLSVIVYRKTAPGIPRPFRFPLVYIFAPLGIIGCLLLIICIDFKISIIYMVWTISIALFYLLFIKNRSNVSNKV